MNITFWLLHVVVSCYQVCLFLWVIYKVRKCMEKIRLKSKYLPVEGLEKIHFNPWTH